MTDTEKRREAFTETRPEGTLRHWRTSPTMFGRHHMGVECPCNPDLIDAKAVTA